jgi:hypothetical protein
MMLENANKNICGVHLDKKNGCTTRASYMNSHFKKGEAMHLTILSRSNI